MIPKRGSGFWGDSTHGSFGDTADLREALGRTTSGFAAFTTVLVCQHHQTLSGFQMFLGHELNLLGCPSVGDVVPGIRLAVFELPEEGPLRCCNLAQQK